MIKLVVIAVLLSVIEVIWAFRLIPCDSKRASGASSLFFSTSSREHFAGLTLHPRVGNTFLQLSKTRNNFEEINQNRQKVREEAAKKPINPTAIRGSSNNSISSGRNSKDNGKVEQALDKKGPKKDQRPRNQKDGKKDGGRGKPTRESVEDLEKQLLAKYGSNAYKEALLEDDFDDDDDDDDYVGGKKIEGFGKGAQKHSSSSTPSSNGVIRKSTSSSRKGVFQGFQAPSTPPATSTPTSSYRLKGENKAMATSPAAVSEVEVTQKQPRKTLLLGKISITRPSDSKAMKNNENDGKDNVIRYDDDDEDAYDYDGKDDDDNDDDDVDMNKNAHESNELRSGPLNAVNGYRLRKPSIKSEIAAANEKEKKDAANAKALALEAERKKKRDAKREMDKSQFFAFDFDHGKQWQEGGGDDGNDDDENGSSNNNHKGSASAIFTTKLFSDIGIEDQQVLRNLERMNIFNPTRIQEQAIPVLMGGQDVILQAQTGSGKTLAFLLPLLKVVNPELKKVQAIVIAPSRELVTQIALVGTSLFQGTGIRVISLIGGANVRNQIKNLREDKPQIVVATPGRLAELVFQLRKLRLGMVRAVVIDEIDNMLREPYIGEIQTILEATPLSSSSLRRKERLEQSQESDVGMKNYDQEGDDVIEDLMTGADSNTNIDSYNDDEEDEDDDGDGSDKSAVNDNFLKRMFCLSSATGNEPEVRSFADNYCYNWQKVSVNSATQLPVSITHGLISCPRVKALELLKKFLNSKPEVKSAIVFVNDPYRVEIICEKLLEMGLIAAPLHGDTSKDDRKEILSRLRDGRVTLVVATELAARGLDIPELTHVINFELPTDAQHYIHRAGRCGRAGRAGLVMNFATPDTKFVIRRFGKQLGVKVMDCEIRDGQVFLKSR